VLFTLRLQAAGRVSAEASQSQQQSRCIKGNAIIDTLAAWQRRYAPNCFAGNVETAAKIAESFLLGQIKEIQREAGRLLAAGE